MLEQDAERLVDSLPQGYSNYLKVQLDPYHDKTIKFEGAPTSRSATSVCLCYNQEMTISADDFTNINEPTWDAHFAMFPMINTITAYLSDEIGGLNRLDETSNALIYPMSVHAVDSGKPTYSGELGDNLITSMKGFDLKGVMTFQTGQPLNDGPGRRVLRIVGESFEVIDESPDIYQQGAVTVYRYPLSLEPVNYTYVQDMATATPKWALNGPPQTPGEFKQYLNCVQIKAPPINTASAVLVPGAETWKAREGVYMVGAQYLSEVPFKQVDETIINLVGYSPATRPTYDPGYFSFTDKSVVVSSGQSVFQGGTDPINDSPNLNAIFPYNLSGAYFTGLSTQYTTLRLRYRVYVEILTDPADNILAPLASATLPYEQDLQQFCMRVIATQPAGVPQTWNPAGEKWVKVLNTIGEVAQDLGPALSKISPQLGLFVGSGGSLLSRATRKKRGKKSQASDSNKSEKKSSPPSAKTWTKGAPKAAPKNIK